PPGASRTTCSISIDTAAASSGSTAARAAASSASIQSLERNSGTGGCYEVRGRSSVAGGRGVLFLDGIEGAGVAADRGSAQPGRGRQSRRSAHRDAPGRRDRPVAGRRPRAVRAARRAAWACAGGGGAGGAGGLSLGLRGGRR